MKRNKKLLPLILLIISAFCVFSYYYPQIIKVWMVVIIILRDVITMTLRNFMLNKNSVLCICKARNNSWNSLPRLYFFLLSWFQDFSHSGILFFSHGSDFFPRFSWFQDFAQPWILFFFKGFLKNSRFLKISKIWKFSKIFG